MSDNQIEKAEHGGKVWSAARENGQDIGNLLDFSANINPYGVPGSVLERLVESIGWIRHYPDPESYELRMILAQKHEIPPSSVLVGNGGIELIYAIARAGQFKNVLIVPPTFGEYERAVKVHGGNVRKVYSEPENNFRFPLEKVVQGLAEVDACFVCTPNNPTGQVISAQELNYLQETCEKRGVTLIIDESFQEFAHPITPSFIQKVGLRDHTIVVRSMTKWYALPGLRLGYVVASPKWIERIDQVRDPWSVNILAQQAGIAALRDLDYETITKRWIRETYPSFHRTLGSFLHIKSVPSAVNFVLFSIPTIVQPELFLSTLQDRGILLRWARSFDLLDETWFRTAIRLPVENEQLFKVLQEVLPRHVTKQI